MIEKRKKLIVAGLILLCILLTIFYTDKNPDIYFMIAHGRFLANNGFISTEPTTVHSAIKFSFEKWISCLAAYFLENNFGMFSLTVFAWFCILVTGLLLYKMSYSLTKNKLKSFLIMALLFGFYSFFYQSLRPSLVSNIIFLLEIITLEAWINKKDNKYLLFLPLLSFLLINIHSTIFVVFYMFAFPYVFIDLKTKEKPSYNFKSSLPFYVAMIASFLTALINPYGFQGITYIFKSLKSNFWDLTITELQPFYSLHSTPFVISSLVLLIIIIYGIRKKSKLIPIRYILLSAMFLLSGLMANRNLQFFLLSSVLLISYLYKEIEFNTNKMAACLSALLIVLTSISAYYNFTIYNNYSPFKYNLPTEYEIVENIEPNSKVYNFLNIGSYLEYKGIRPYISTKMEVYAIEVNETKDIVKEYLEIEDGKIEIDVLQKEYDFDYYLVNKKSTINEKIKAAGFELIDENEYLNLYKTKRED